MCARQVQEIVLHSHVTSVMFSLRLRYTNHSSRYYLDTQSEHNKQAISHLSGETSLAIKSRLLSAHESEGTACWMQFCVRHSGLQSRLLDTLDCDHCVG